MITSLQPSPTNTNLPTKLRILTIGDGDFSASLALLRAYPSLIQRLVATSLLSYAQVTETYPRAIEIIKELEQIENVDIVYGVDATQLHVNMDLSGAFDVVMFHHPHLGYDTVVPKDNVHQHDNATKDQSTDDARNSNNSARRHECLIAHYLHSASQLLKKNNATNKETPNILPCIHLCLCASSIENWNILQSVNDQGLQFAWGSPTAASSPTFQYYEQLLLHDDSDSICANEMQRQDVEKRLRECQRAKRKGHWLGRHGYRHQPTFPDSTEFGNSTVSNSFHLFLTRSSGVPPCVRCRVCNEEFQCGGQFSKEYVRA